MTQESSEVDTWVVLQYLRVIASCTPVKLVGARTLTLWDFRQAEHLQHVDICSFKHWY